MKDKKNGFKIIHEDSFPMGRKSLEGNYCTKLRWLGCLDSYCLICSMSFQKINGLLWLRAIYIIILLIGTPYCYQQGSTLDIWWFISGVLNKGPSDGKRFCLALFAGPRDEWTYFLLFSGPLCLVVQPSSSLKEKTEKKEYLGILTDTVQLAGLVTAVRRELKPLVLCHVVIFSTPWTLTK